VRIFIRVVVVVLVLAGCAWAANRWWSSRAKADADQPTAVRVEPAARGTLVEFISAAGEIQPRARVSISARVSARIAELPYKEGDVVTKGNPNANPPVPPSMLVKLDSKDLEAQLKSVEARRAAEQASLEVSRTRVAVQQAQIDAIKVMQANDRRELKRKIELLANKDVSQSEVDQLQAKVDQQAAQVLGAIASLKAEEGGLVVLQHNIEAAKAEIAKARDNLTYATITSPIDGIVTRLNAEVGEVAMTGTMNNAGTMIMEVADLSQMVLEAKVDETSIDKVEVGQKAKIKVDAFGDKEIVGEVIQKTPLAVGKSQTSGGLSTNINVQEAKEFKVTVELKDMPDEIRNGLRPGMSATATITTKVKNNVVAVPLEAIVEKAPNASPSPAATVAGSTPAPPNGEKVKNLKGVYVIEGTKVRFIEVTTGITGEADIEITSGVQAGMEIVRGPSRVLKTLKDGMSVKRQTKKPGANANEAS